MISELYQHITNTDEHVTRELKHAIQYAMIVLTPIAIGTYTIKQYTPQTQDKVSINMAMEIIAILIAIITITFAADRIGTFFIPEGDYRIITILVLFIVIADSSIGRNIRNIIQWGVRDPPGPPTAGNNQDQKSDNNPTIDILRPQHVIRQPTTVSGGDIRPPPSVDSAPSVGPGQQPDFDDMYGGYETPNYTTNEVDAFGGW